MTQFIWLQVQPLQPLQARASANKGF
jgi:hypothetical protein